MSPHVFIIEYTCITDKYVYSNTSATKKYLISKKFDALSPLVFIFEYIYITDKYVYFNTRATKKYLINEKPGSLSPLVPFIDIICRKTEKNLPVVIKNGKNL